MKTHLVLSLILACISTTAQAQSKTSQADCGRHYERVPAYMKNLLGKDKDGMIAPRADEFLKTYAKYLGDMPSREEYTERLKRNNPSPMDYEKAYLFMQEFMKREDWKRFTDITDVLDKTLKLAEAGNDRASIVYAKCLRDHMAGEIISFADSGHYILKKEILLSKLIPPEAPKVAPTQQEPAGAQ